MNETFRQIVFPALPKKDRVIVAPAWDLQDSSKNLVLDGIYCDLEKEWVDLAECICCTKGTRKIEDIMQDMVGCS